MIKRVREEIARQQSNLEEGSPTWVVGEHLKDIIGEDEKAAEVVLTDLKVAEMNIAECEKKIKEYADGHKQEGFAFVPPKVAEGIIREFYGVAELPKEEKTEKINIADFF